jgi:hypothetical protein
MASDRELKLSNIVKLRMDQSGDYEYFVCFLVPTVTNTRWSKRGNSMARRCFSTCATSTDESFAVLTFENNYHVWVYEYKQKVKDGQRIAGTTCVPFLPRTSVVYVDSPDRKQSAIVAGAPPDKSEQEQDIHKPKPMYTRVEECEGRRYQGWSEDGLDRFNQLDDMVRRDRIKNKQWDEKFLEFHRVRLGTYSGGKRQADTFQDPKKFTRPRMNLEEAFALQGKPYATKKNKHLLVPGEVGSNVAAMNP